ncbi:thiolase family protein [Variovorax sp. PBL-E5]|uniref:thiolase family protein n=1 Tax=Variovorax sp. PBL-E5 TaxID=434014 RepID=UPI00131940A2|nr:thiolase family protein [Variovorax sp. PBL-E5]VTU20379.1 Acetyl-CoA acetyltransferase [Variovorax sp. PBL-E5]
MTEAYVPYGGYWCSPFARWQGSLSHLHALEFGAWLARESLAERDIDTALIDSGVLGTTIPQRGAFYGLPWVAALAGMPHLAGPTIAQACATSARCVSLASQEVAFGASQCTLVITADRVSNGPQIYYPDPRGPGGAGENESWVMANFERDPWAGVPMVRTAENVAARFGIGTEAQHELVLQRYAQYGEALKDDGAFHARFMRLPFAVPDAAFRKTVATLQGDEGIHATTREGLARLRPVIEGGTVTHGAQTHPADGSAGMLVASRERARQLTRRPEIEIRIVATGQARTDIAAMPYAPVPAAREAMARAGLRFDELHAVTTHNPFIVNDIVLARETGLDAMEMNRFGCSLVWGHPQAPTGLRAIIELIEALEMRGGGHGLFTGCAAGDSAMAVVVEVTDARA